MISVVMCTYNGERYLLEQLQSILDQTFKDIEIIINDDCSSDNTLDIVKSLEKQDSRIRVFQNEQNLGFNLNFEKALSYAKGDYVALCDQDDIWHLDKLEKLVTLMKLKECMLVYSNSRLVDSQGKSLNTNLFKELRKIPLSGDDCYLGLIYENCIAGHTILFRSQLLQYIFPIPEGIFFDRWIGFVASLFGRIDFVNETLVDYRRHDNNVTEVQKVHKKKKKYNEKIVKKTFSFENRVKELEYFSEFIDRYDPDSKYKKAVSQIYKVSYLNSISFFNYKLFFILLKYRKKIFAMKSNTLIPCFKLSYGIKAYRYLPFL